MCAGMTLNIQNLIDDRKCFETVRQMCWPGGVACPHCTSLAWIPMQGKLANRMPICSKILYYVVVLVLEFTPRSAEVPGWHYPKTSRKRLFPSHGTAASV